MEAMNVASENPNLEVVSEELKQQPGVKYVVIGAWWLVVDDTRGLRVHT